MRRREEKQQAEPFVPYRGCDEGSLDSQLTLRQNESWNQRETEQIRFDFFKKKYDFHISEKKSKTSGAI